MTRFPRRLTGLLAATALAATPLALHAGAGRAYAAGVPAADAPLKVRSVGVSGNALVPSSELDDALPFHAGDTITSDDIKRGADAVGAVYGKHNVGAHLATRTTYYPNNTVSVLYTISGETPPPTPTTTRAQLIADSVTIEGNKQVPTDKLTQAIHLHAGAPVTNEGLAADVKAIQKVYQDADIGMNMQPVISYPQPNHVVIVYRIVEK